MLWQVPFNLVCMSLSCRLSWAQKTRRSHIWMASTIIVWLQGRGSDPWTTCLEERRLLLPWLCSSLFTGETAEEFRVLNMFDLKEKETLHKSIYLCCLKADCNICTVWNIVKNNLSCFCLATNLPPSLSWMRLTLLWTILTLARSVQKIYLIQWLELFNQCCLWNKQCFFHHIKYKVQPIISLCTPRWPIILKTSRCRTFRPSSFL